MFLRWGMWLPWNSNPGKLSVACYGFITYITFWCWWLETRILQFLASALTLFTEYTAWATFWAICKWGTSYMLQQLQNTRAILEFYSHTKFHHCSPYRTLGICLSWYKPIRTNIITLNNLINSGLKIDPGTRLAQSI